MAGSYDDVPAPRIAYDRDGTIGFNINEFGVITPWTQDDLEKANDEDSDTTTSAGSGRDSYAGLIFPHPMTIVGIFWCGNITNQGNRRKPLFQISEDTTNGQDGSWTDLVTLPVNVDMVFPDYRTNITVLDVPAQNVKGIRTRAEVLDGTRDGWHWWRCVHFYGYPETPPTHRLALWDPSEDEEITDGAYLDWGNVVRDFEYTKAFRVKNVSDTFIAEDVGVATDIPTDAEPSLADDIAYEIATDPGNWVSALDLGDLEPGEISEVITVRYTPASDAQLGVHTWRTLVEAVSWATP